MGPPLSRLRRGQDSVLKRWKQFSAWQRLTLAGLCLLTLLAAGALVWHGNPGVAARGAEVLRGLIGDENVARLETWVLGWQDTFQSWVYTAGGDKPQAPFASVTPGLVALLPTSTARPISSATDSHPLPTATATPGERVQAQTPTPSPTPAPANQPAPLKPLGRVAGEGAWSVFMSNPAGQPVGFRTFLQPDGQRPYAEAAVVAIDLTATRLRYVLGNVEPVAIDPTLQINRPGRIPANDFKSGWLVAAFNGGFRTRHGQFGVMINGVVLLAPRESLGTVAIYDDGHVALGPWGEAAGEIFYADDLRNWRQNGPLIVQNGQINPHTADPSPEDWGYTVGGDTATWRSGIGLSADGHTLFYVGGPFLTLPALAAAMKNTGANNAIQLDINDYWVNFEAIHYSVGGLTTQLLMDGMKNDDRYLRSFDRDFFYVVANPN